MVGNSSSQRLLTVFLQEARERTASMERDLLRLRRKSNEEARKEAVQNILRSAHSLKGAAHLIQLHDFELVCHWMEELLTRSAKEGTTLAPRHIELLLSATDALAATLPVLEQSNELNLDRLESMRAELEAASHELPCTENEPTKAAEPDRSAPRTRIHREKAKPRTDDDARAAGDFDLDPFVRVPSERLDTMLAHSGELLLARTAVSIRTEQLSRIREILRKNQAAISAGVKRDLDLELQVLQEATANDYRSLKRISIELDADIRNARLQPFRLVCEGLERLIRELATGSGKQVELEVEGGHIEIDRLILEELRTAIRHLVRNAVDHGIETSKERVAAGKQAQGRILIAASLHQDRIVITISDDGRGLATKRVKQAVIELGLDERIADEDAEQLIFLLGVSTARTTTRVSGRGVGLDAVRKSVENMRGAIQVESTQQAGVTFTIILPLTVGSIRALLLRCGGQLFAIDSAAVTSVFRFSTDQITTSGAAQFVVRSNRQLRLARLADWLQIEPPEHPESQRQLIGLELANAGQASVIEVDETVAEQEFVIRSLGPRLTNLTDYSGAIIMPDGGLALVLNAAAIGSAVIREAAKPRKDNSKHRHKLHRILIVDDSLTTRTLEKTILEGAGYEVFVAADGLEAWQVLEERGADLLLADVDMPGMDGFMLTEKVRQSVKFRDLPIILLTARQSSEDRQRGLHLGADAYLVKSAFDQRELLSTIGQLL